MRLNLASDIDSRDGASAKDESLTNCLKEVKKSGEKAVVRPGLSLDAQASGVGNGLVVFNNELVSVYGATLGFGVEEGADSTAHIIPGDVVGGDLPELVSLPEWLNGTLYAVGYPNPENGLDGWVAGTTNFGGSISVAIPPPGGQPIRRLFTYNSALYCLSGGYIWSYNGSVWVQGALNGSGSDMSTGFAARSDGSLWQVIGTEISVEDDIFPGILARRVLISTGALTTSFEWIVGPVDGEIPQVAPGELSGEIYGLAYYSATGAYTVFRIDGTTSHTDLFSGTIATGMSMSEDGFRLLQVGATLQIPFLVAGNASCLIATISIDGGTLTLGQSFGSDYPIFTGTQFVSAATTGSKLTVFRGSYDSSVPLIHDVYIYDLDSATGSIPALATITGDYYDFAQSPI